MFVEITDKRGLVIPINTTHIGYYYTKADPKPTCVLQMQGGKVMNAEFDSSEELQDFIDLINSSGSGGGGGGTPSIKDGGLIQKPTKDDFPAVGDVKNVYIAQDTAKPYYWSSKDNKYKEFAGGGTGSAFLEKDITSNEKCGAAPSGSFFPQGMTFTQFAEKVLRKDIAPTVSLSTNNGNKLFEMGTILNGDNLKLTITNLAQVTLPINGVNFYVASSKINSSLIPFVTGTSVYQKPYTNNITTNTTLKGELVYNTNQKVSASQAVGFAYASYWGVINQASLTSAELSAIIASIGLTGTNSSSTVGNFTKRLSNNKAFAINNMTLNDQRYCYIIPTNIGGKLTSIKDGNNFEYLTNGGTEELTLNGVTAANGDSISYYVYILKDPTTGTGFKFNFV